MVQCVLSYQLSPKIASYLHFCLLSPLSPFFLAPYPHSDRYCLLLGEKRVPCDREDVDLPGGLRHLRLQDEAGVHEDEQHHGEGGGGGGQVGAGGLCLEDGHQHHRVL